MLVKARAVSSALIFKFDGNEFLFRYSTAAAIAPTHLLVKYLINSLGFSNEEAIPLSAKVTRINSFKNPDLAINFFKQTGFDNTQIKTMVSEFPELLFCDVEKTLKPKFQCLSELGLSDSDLVKVVLRDWKFLERGLDNCIKPLLSCFKNVLVSDENVVKVIKRSSWLISYSSRGTIEANINLLLSFGCLNDKIKNIVTRHPKFLQVSTQKLEEMLHRAEKEVGVSRDSTVFLPVVSVLSSLNQENVDTKFRIFKSFGWSDTDILTILQKLPYCLGLSETRIQAKLTFLMKEVRYKSIYIASRPSLNIQFGEETNTQV